MRSIGAGFRATDDPEDGEVYRRVRRYERARTVFLSMLCSGFLSLALLYPIEVQNTKNDRDNCRITNSTPRLLADQANQQADNVLGNEQKAIHPFRFKGTTLADFKPLIVAQARTNRLRAIQYARSVRNCEVAFPYPRFFGVDVVPGD